MKIEIDPKHTEREREVLFQWATKMYDGEDTLDVSINLDKIFKFYGQIDQFNNESLIIVEFIKEYFNRDTEVVKRIYKTTLENKEEVYTCLEGKYDSWDDERTDDTIFDEFYEVEPIVITDYRKVNNE